MSLEAIFAMSQNRVIGKDGKIPWYLPEDLKLFKEITLGHRVIMGRKTFESLNKQSLPNRENIVISRQVLVQSGFSFYQTITGFMHSLEQQILDKSPPSDKQEKKNFIIGGAEIFQIFLPMIQKVYLSVVQKNFEGDTYLPAFETDFRQVTPNLEKLTVDWENSHSLDTEQPARSSVSSPQQRSLF